MKMIRMKSLREKLRMEKVIFDSNFVPVNGFRSGCYDVYYVLYYDPKPRHKNSIYIPEDPVTEYKVSRNTNSACFSGVKSMLMPYLNLDPYCKSVKHDVPVPNKMYYKMNFKNAGKPILKKSERYAWLKMCKKHNLLPNYIVPSTVVTGKVVFDMVGISPSLLYAYLTMMRAIVEYPAFVRSTVYLVNKVGMDFYAAFVYTTKYYITNYGHHIIAPNYNHGSSNRSEADLTNMKNIDLDLMVGLYRFFKNPEKFDDRHVSEICKGSWQCDSTIKDICKVKYCINAADLFKPSLKKIIETDTDKEVRKYIEDFTKEPSVRIVIKDISVKPKKSLEGENEST